MVSTAAGIGNWLPGNRYHVSASWSETDGKLTLSIDGEVVSQTIASWDVDSISDSLCFGCLMPEGDFAAGAQLEELRIYRTADERELPAAPQLESPANGQTDLLPELQLEWEPVPSANSYRLQVSETVDFDSLLIDLAELSSTTVSVVLEEDNSYYWRVGSVTDVGLTSWSAVWNFVTQPLTGLGENDNQIQEFELYPNYPNPFNAGTLIRYDVPRDAWVHLAVYNLLGEEVDILVDRYCSRGSYTAAYQAGDLPSGMYLYALRSGNYQRYRKLLLLK